MPNKPPLELKRVAPNVDFDALVELLGGMPLDCQDNAREVKRNEKRAARARRELGVNAPRAKNSR